MTTRLDLPCTHAEFGLLLGITRQAVSDMAARGVLIPGDTMASWIQKYCAHLREQAAGRDSELSKQRALDTEVSRKLKEVTLAERLRESINVGAIEMVLAGVGNTISSKLAPLPGELQKICPAITPEVVALMQRAINEACDLATAASLDMLTEPEEDEEDAPGQGDAEALSRGSD
jgi:phage terminase Nu1 subunit (DNA packaging protein)